MITSFKGEDTSFAVGNLTEQAGTTFSSPPGSKPGFGEISVSPGGQGLSGYHMRLAEAHPTLRIFVHGDPGADGLPAPSPDEFDQGTLEWVFGKADHIAVCWPASSEDLTQVSRLAEWTTRTIRKSTRGFVVVRTTAEWHLHWLYSAFNWRRKGVKVAHFGEFPARPAGAR
jgi:hypothetical protein